MLARLLSLIDPPFSYALPALLPGEEEAFFTCSL